MKKRLWIYPLFCLALGALTFGYMKVSVQLPSFDLKDLWISSRPLSEKIAMDAYLSGNVARGDQDLERAVQAYLRVLQKDPGNTRLLEETYFLAMIQGVPEGIMPYLDGVRNDKMLIDYARVAYRFQKGEFDEALSKLTRKKEQPVDALLKPLVSAWIYAAKEDKQKAVDSLSSLSKEFSFVAGYQKVLLGTYFKDQDLVQKGIFQMGDHNVPAVGYFPLLKKAINQTGNWEKSALNVKYKELANDYPATANLLVQIGQTDLTVNKGLAESFYLVSALGGNGSLTREDALALNSLALLFDSEKQMGLVWGAELAEGVHLPRVALSYYRRLKFHSATLDFKEAADMMLVGQAKEALRKLEALEATNKTSIPLLTLLGQAYQEAGENKKALVVYNRLIPLLEESPKNEPLVQAYLIRGGLYGMEESEKMLQDLMRAQILDPENAMVLNDLGYHQLEMGLVEEGFEMVQKANQKKPNDPYILDSLAFGYWKKGQPQIALPLAEKALNLMPQSALINAHLGDIYAELGRRREASFQYKKALDLKTDLTDDLTQELTLKLKGEM